MHFCFLELVDVMVLVIMASSVSAQNCTPGTFMGAESCVKCETGKYSNKVDASSCRHCPSGSAVASTDEGASSCTDCQPGQYAPWGSGTCNICDIGTFSDQAKSATCAVCPPGKYAKNPGSTACNLDPYCAKGYGTEITELHGDPTCLFDPEYNSE